MQMRSAAVAGLAVFLFVAGNVTAQQSSDAKTTRQSDAATTLTIYNQDFALARSTVDLNLNAGTTEVTTTNVTRQLEPDSVVLRDPAYQDLLHNRAEKLVTLFDWTKI